eukprot:TRINITY_DN37784_c0_g1_i1.p2 TRINITY_DN37784_c0_g1~~TRINITY_DN37784_c0_g1_i1.p2  ORF type:complete len:238 (+),score=85.34 TRINITY_DN37784_c0_g1_i1:53-766(+)
MEYHRTGTDPVGVMDDDACAHEEAELLQAREDAHRAMVDFVSHKNVANLLAEKLAEQTREADVLRARLGAGGGRNTAARLAEHLASVERQLGRERARATALGRELTLLRNEAERRGLPKAKTKQQYEEEVCSLRAKYDEQHKALTAAVARSREAAEQPERSAEPPQMAELRDEAARLRAAVHEKKRANQELAAMLQLHLSHNAEWRARALLKRPQWEHPLLRGAKATTAVPEWCRRR